MIVSPERLSAHDRIPMGCIRKISGNLLAIYMFLLAFPCLSLGATAPSGSAFMDMELFINERETLIRETSPALALVVAYDETGEMIDQGTGIFISQEGHIVTNASLLEGAYSAEVLSASSSYTSIAVLNRDSDTNLALLRVEAENAAYLPLSGDSPAEEGERVYIIGRSSGLTTTFSEGTIVRDDRNHTSDILAVKPLVSILSYNKSKDGPLLNSSGNLLGIIDPSFLDRNDHDGIPWRSENQSYYVTPSSTLKRFLSRPEEAAYLRAAGSKIWTKWIVRSLQSSLISAFVVLYTMGFQKLLGIAVLFFIGIALLQWIYNKIRQKTTRH
jgi:S1-C subfamily serine protease